MTRQSLKGIRETKGGCLSKGGNQREGVGPNEGPDKGMGYGAARQSNSRSTSRSTEEERAPFRRDLVVRPDDMRAKPRRPFDRRHPPEPGRGGVDRKRTSDNQVPNRDVTVTGPSVLAPPSPTNDSPRRSGPNPVTRVDTATESGRGTPGDGTEGGGMSLYDRAPIQGPW